MGSDRFPGYDVLAKRNTPSWNETTRRVIDRRLAISREPRFFSEAEWQTLNAICDRVMPQPKNRAPVPLAAMIDQKMFENKTDGYRDYRLPKMQDAWRCGLAALAAEARQRHGRSFHEIAPHAQDAILRDAQEGRLGHEAWGTIGSEIFFAKRLLPDIVTAYYAHPTAWSEIGFGGPASPRGYVRMDFDRRDPWEAAEAQPGRESYAYQRNRDVG
jgi:hypothetical protein